MSQSPPPSLKHLTVIGVENIPAKEGFMLLPSQLDLLTLRRIEHLLKDRSIVYLLEEGAGIDPQVKAHLESEHVNALSIDPETTDVASYRAALRGAVKGGAVIFYLPAKAASSNAPVTTVPGAKLDFLMKADVPVVPCYVQLNRDVCLPVVSKPGEDSATIAFGKALADDELSLASYQESLFGLAEQCFSSLPALGCSLGYALIKGLKKHATRNQVIDGKDDSVLTFDKILAAAIALSKVIKAETQKPRVGIVLPPSPIGLIANLAVVFAGKTPVNLNFTAGRAATESAIKQADLDKFLTADTFVRKVQSFPWPPMKNLVLLERLMPTLKVKIGIWFVLSKILPASLLAFILGISRQGGKKEATLLFTSGSSGDPKGVVLTHRNLLGNVIQFGTRLNLAPNDSILGCLPLFHSFGCTVTLWYPVIFGLDLVYYPTPLEVKKLAELIQKHKISVMIATPTFLRGYLKGVNREQLASIKLVVTGAEKLPRALAESFETRFGKQVLEGYGLTETSPAVK